MSNTTHQASILTSVSPTRRRTAKSSSASRRTWGRPVTHLVVLLFMIIWFTPVLGLFVSSVRTQTDTAAVAGGKLS